MRGSHAPIDHCMCEGQQYTQLEMLLCQCRASGPCWMAVDQTRMEHTTSPTMTHQHTPTRAPHPGRRIAVPLLIQEAVWASECCC